MRGDEERRRLSGRQGKGNRDQIALLRNMQRREVRWSGSQRDLNKAMGRSEKKEKR